MTERRSLRGLLVAQFFGAFNDSAWKMIVIALAGRALAGRDLAPAERDAAAQQDAMLASLALTVPMLLFSLPGGALADRVSKRAVIVALKVLELALMAAGALLLARDPSGGAASFVILGLMGVQSALFSPAKYGILPELVPHQRLSAANGQIEMGTFAAIVAGTALGPALLAAVPAPAGAGAVLAALGGAGIVAALFVERTRPARSEGGIGATVRLAVATLKADRALWLAVLGLAWFWAIASLLGQDVVVYARTVLELPESRQGWPFGVFAIGVGVGSLFAGKLSGGKVELGLIPLGAVLLGGFTLLLGLAPAMAAAAYAILFLLGASSAFLVVPLQALLQWRSPADRRGAVIAVSNVFVYGGMVLGALAGGLLAKTGLSARGILVAAALITFLGTAWAIRLLPEALLRLVLFLITHTVYRLRVIGRANVPPTGGVLLAPNHVSFVDGLFLIATIDRPIRFIVDQGQFDRPFLRPFLKVMQAIPIKADGGPRAILRALRDAGRFLDEGEVVCIFPEGQITRTGAMLPFRRGIERIAKGRTSPIVPVHLDRVWGSIFSFAKGRFVWKLPERIPYRVTVSYGAPLSSDTPPALVRQRVMELGCEAWRERKSERPALHRTFVSSVRRRPWKLQLADASRPRVSRLAALAAAVLLARRMRPHWRGGERAGLLLPQSVIGAVANVAAALAGKASVNLNFTAGAAGMASAARQARLASVLTSRAFVAKAGVALPEGVAPLYVEDVLASPGALERLRAAVLALFAPQRLLERACGAARPVGNGDVATVIFSSGSTGEPKGVMLTHFNVDSNVEGVAQVFRAAEEDRLLGILPLFHSFGFLSTWFALNQGVPIVFHPNPLDAAAVGSLVAEYRVTLLLATPTFLSIYTRRCSAEQFGSLRLVLAGAEKLHDRVATAFEESFGVRPVEGYGATECAPVVAASVPSFRAPGFFQAGARRGTVGPPLPGVAVRVVDPDTHAPVAPGQPGLLLVQGPNVMKGYLGRDDLTSAALKDGWYVTGDIAVVDDDGFVRITDRLSRFSKIGGEMVPHGRIEEALHEAFGKSDAQVFAVTALPDEKKGERIAVVTTVDLAEVPVLLERLAAAGLPNLFIPRADAFVRVEAIPILGTGKVDLRGVKRAAAERLG